MIQGDVEALALARIARDDMDAINLRHAPRRGFEVAILGLQVHVDAAPASDAAIVEPRDVLLAWNDAALTLRCPASLLDALLALLDSGFVDRPRPGDDLLALVLQLAVDGWPLAVADVRAPPDNAAPGAGLLVEANGQAYRCELVSEAAAWPNRGVSEHVLALPVAVAVRSGVTRLPVAVVASLREGDAVLIEFPGHAPARAWLVLAERWLAGLERAGDVWQLTEAPHQAGIDERDWLMVDQDDDSRPRGPEDIPVTLAFDVGRVEMTVGAFARLGQGSIIELDRSPPALVDIRANGRRIGRGELVDLDGSAAVRIVRLFDGG